MHSAQPRYGNALLLLPFLLLLLLLRCMLQACLRRC
jgi:hypothetical protein